MVASLHTALPHLRSGTLRALSVSSGAEYPELAGVPSMHDAGLAELDIAQWYALFAPRETPVPIVKKLNAELTAMLSRAEVKDHLRSRGAIPVGGTPDKLVQLLVTESQRWQKVIDTLRTPTLSEAVD